MNRPQENQASLTSYVALECLQRERLHYRFVSGVPRPRREIPPRRGKQTRKDNCQARNYTPRRTIFARNPQLFENTRIPTTVSSLTLFQLPGPAVGASIMKKAWMTISTNQFDRIDCGNKLQWQLTHLKIMNFPILEILYFHKQI